MPPFERYDGDHPLYPRRLGRLPSPPAFAATGPIPDVRAVAIVGSREPVFEAAEFARSLARDLAKAGIAIVSGGAKGIDAAAHRGALDAGGATWVVCPTGKDRVAPEEHRQLFETIARSADGRLIWPFADDAPPKRETYRARNGILVALSEAVVVIQARLASGSRNACLWARSLDKPLWVVPALPWGHWEQTFNGSADVLLRDGKARALGSRAQLFEALGLPLPARQRRPKRRTDEPVSQFLSMPPEPVPDASWTQDEIAIFSVTSPVPRHREILAEKSSLPIGLASTALLTLSLKDVVVEGPDGFFRRK